MPCSTRSLLRCLLVLLPLPPSLFLFLCLHLSSLVSLLVPLSASLSFQPASAGSTTPPTWSCRVAQRRCFTRHTGFVAGELSRVLYAQPVRVPVECVHVCMVRTHAHECEFTSRARKAPTMRGRRRCQRRSLYLRGRNSLCLQRNTLHQHAGL